jgi:hypothetical protein
VANTGNEWRQAYSLALSHLVSWGIEEQVAYRIIGMPHCETQEVKRRVNVILEIDERLKMIFENPKNIIGFMSMKNDNGFFMGKSPLEKISDGTFESLQECAIRIQVLSMG